MSAVPVAPLTCRGDQSVQRPWMRNTAIGCAIACGAMVAGPGTVGTAVASADLFGIGHDILDILGHKDKKKNKDHGARPGGPQTGGANRVGGPSKPGQAGPKTPKTSVGANTRGARSDGTGTRSPGASESSGPANRSAATTDSAAASTIGVTGGGAAEAAPGPVNGGSDSSGLGPVNGSVGRAPNLAPVPTAPSSRRIVIRAQPPTVSAPSAPNNAPAAPVAPVAAPPVVPIAPPPVVIVPPAIAAPISPGGAPATPVTPLSPSVQPPETDVVSGRVIPASFRIGYADYLRVASTTDLLFAVLPGLAGIVLLTAAGGVVGFRQARASQNLPEPQIARFLP